MISDSQKNELLNLIKSLGEEAEEIKKTNLHVSYKIDNSPLSEADLLINGELIRFIKKTKYQNIVSEESAEIKYDTRKKWDFFWVIDPIDGTKEYINRGKDYTLNIALCHIDKPIFSIVYAPAREELYFAIKGKGAKKNFNQIWSERSSSSDIRIVASKSHLDDETNKFIESISAGGNVKVLNFGSSLKICKVGEGCADFYPRFSPTMEWDTCAAQLILEEAGGAILSTETKKPLIYNKPSLINPSFICTVKKNV